MNNPDSKTIFVATRESLQRAAGHYFQQELDEKDLEDVEKIVYSMLFDTIGEVYKEAIGEVIHRNFVNGVNNSQNQIGKDNDDNIPF